MNDQAWKGLESAALALIFAPEPFTTPLGIALLIFARHMRQEQQKAARQSRPHYSFHDYYNCRVGMVNGSAIAYNITSVRQGQLPLRRSTISKLYENRPEWEAYHRTVNLRTKTRVNISRPSYQQPAGLLQTPVLRYQSGLRPKRVEI
jgi:hypothetical protein